MSIFLLVKDTCCQYNISAYNCLATNAGFLPKRLRVPFGYSYYWYEIENRSAFRSYNLPMGTTLHVFGQLLYNGRANENAMDQMIRHVENQTIDWANLSGCFVAVSISRTMLTIFADPFGACKIYHTDDRTAFSNAFLGAAYMVTKPTLFMPACYEYAYAGSLYGADTMVKEVKMCAPTTVIAADGSSVRTAGCRLRIPQRPWGRSASLTEIADELCRRLVATTRAFLGGAKQKVRLSFSGGYDSRLLLAVLRHIGSRPDLFTYGAVDDPDVVVARSIAARLGLDLEIVDKSQLSAFEADDPIRRVERDFLAFDGFKSDNGIFSSGVDYGDRIRRSGDGAIVLNGSLGEIYRNFFYLTDRPYNVQQIVSCFYSQYDPSSGATCFDDLAFRHRMGENIKAAIECDGELLDRVSVERIYPEFRGRYWTGRDVQLNYRFGTMWFPYLEPSVIADTATVPKQLKSLGVLQGQMIAGLDKELARQPSVYGYDLGGRRPRMVCMAGWLNENRPMWLRRSSYRIQHRKPQHRPQWLRVDGLSEIMDLRFPYTRALFRHERLYQNTLYNRVLSIEYMAQKLNLYTLPSVDLQSYFRQSPS